VLPQGSAAAAEANASALRPGRRADHGSHARPVTVQFRMVRLSRMRCTAPFRATSNRQRASWAQSTLAFSVNRSAIAVIGGVASRAIRGRFLLR
jgi:hypothetical protein